jgi:putative IMPACT (imprinted ancient) family translation regulator
MKKSRIVYAKRQQIGIIPMLQIKRERQSFLPKASPEENEKAARLFWKMYKAKGGKKCNRKKNKNCSAAVSLENPAMKQSADSGEKNKQSAASLSAERRMRLMRKKMRTSTNISAKCCQEILEDTGD